MDAEIIHVPQNVVMDANKVVILDALEAVKKSVLRHAWVLVIISVLEVYLEELTNIILECLVNDVR